MKLTTAFYISVIGMVLLLTFTITNIFPFYLANLPKNSLLPWQENKIFTEPTKDLLHQVRKNTSPQKNPSKK